MELEEIIAWIESEIKVFDSEVKFYNSENDVVGAGFFYKESIKYKKVLEYLKELRAQPKIIYCKECKHCKATEFSTGRKGFMCMKWILETDSDWYCSRAERETE